MRYFFYEKIVKSPRTGDPFQASLPPAAGCFSSRTPVSNWLQTFGFAKCPPLNFCHTHIFL